MTDMALSEDMLRKIEQFLLADCSNDNVTDFRAAFPGVTLTRCDPGDMAGEVPFRSYAEFDVYLVDAREHCVQLTGDPEAATGIVLTRKRGMRV